MNRPSHQIPLFHRTTGALLVLPLLAFHVGCARAPEPPMAEHRTMALETLVEIKLPVEMEPTVHAAMVASASAMDAVGAKLNFYDPDSLLGQLNRHPEQTAPVTDPDLVAALEVCLTVARETDGALDPSMGFLFQHVWKFDEEEFRVPGPMALAYARPFFGWEGVRLEPHPAGVNVWRASERLSIELGSVAKGRALVAGAHSLRQAGHDAFLINAGGDILAGDPRPNGQPWRVGIQHPRRNDGIIFTSVEIANEALATAGDYQKYVLADGLRYHHILDPRTGAPSLHALSATVIAPTPDAADALATAAFNLGRDAPQVIPRAAAALGLPPESVSVMVVLPHGEVIHANDGRWNDTPAKLRLVANPDDPEP